MKTAAIYIRVSSEEQAQKGYSIPEQQHQCKQLAARLGVADPVVIVDPGVTASVLDRPGIQKLLALVGTVDYVICKDPDRLSRNLGHQLLLTDKIDRDGTKLLFVDFELKDTPESRLFYALRGAVAEFERAKTTQRLMSGKWQKARQGGIPAYIDMLGYTQIDSELVIDPEEAAIVRQIFDWFINGMDEYDPPTPLVAIARKLHEMGIRGTRGGKIGANSVSNMLRNETYNGTLYVRRYDSEGVVANPYLPPEERVRVVERPRDEWIGIDVPKIIDDETWAEAQRMYAILRRIRPRRERIRLYLLTGIATCSRCGGAMVGTTVKRRKSRAFYYYCNRRDNFGRDACGMSYARAIEIETAVWEQVEAWIREPALLEAAAATEADAETTTNEPPEQLEDALNKVREERKRLLRLFQSGLVPDDEIEANLLELKGRESFLLSRLHTSRSEAPADAAKLKQRADSLKPLLSQALSPEQKQQVIREMIEQVFFLGRQKRSDPYEIEIVPRQI